MGLGNVKFSSDRVDYSTPIKLFTPINDEFNLELDVCANNENHKLNSFFVKEDNALSKDWKGNCWMNPPFCKDLGKWVKKAHSETQKHGGTKVCLIPVRSNTKWWAEVVKDAEVRFINGEVNFNEEPRGLWLPMCFLIFGEKAKVGNFSVVNYRKS